MGIYCCYVHRQRNFDKQEKMNERKVTDKQEKRGRTSFLAVTKLLN